VPQRSEPVKSNPDPLAKDLESASCFHATPRRALVGPEARQHRVSGRRATEPPAMFWDKHH
jgi:hypothetical protein